MARRPRLQLPGAVNHVRTRGNRKCAIYEDDADREIFMRLVADVHRRYEVRFYGLCLMTTHYHAIVETPRANLSDAMRQLNGVFAERTNRRHQRSGHLFGQRFSSTVIERDRYLRRVSRYLARNPVKANIVDDPANWPWSTYRATAGLEPCPEWLTTDWLPWAFGADSLQEAQRRYIDYVNTPRDKRPINWHAIAYGSAEFEAALAEVVRRRRAERPLRRIASVTVPPPLGAIFSDVESRAHRDRLIELAHVTHGYTLAEISRHLHLDDSAGARILERLRKSRQQA
jgi:REP element-mobilizing transposase RayT